ncbi:MAG: TraR/DksA C4-type zinc finger protein [Coriobacteriia bacterium]
MLDDKTFSALRLALQEDLARIEADVAELDRHERESQSEASGENVYRDHMADQGSATFERELDMTFEENERDLLGETRAALARMDAGTYGTCERCGAEIPAARLEAVPTASLCIKCKEVEESR